MSLRTICRVPGSSRGGEGPRGRNGMVFARVIGLLALAVSVGSVCAQGSCGLSWAPGFGPLGTQGAIESMAVYDDGSGPALYVAGRDLSAAGPQIVNGIARWDGVAWSPVGGGWSGVTPIPLAMIVYDDGSGSALHVAGTFVFPGAPTTYGLARWDGIAWSYFASVGTFPAQTGGILDLAVFDDGSGPALYVAGSFSQIDGVPANGVARWDGTTWTPLVGGGLAPAGGSGLEVHDDGSGPALYVTGSFSTAGGVPIGGIARWNGTSWFAVGAGITPLSPRALVVFDDGTGPALFAEGAIAGPGGTPARAIYRWDGVVWTPLGAGLFPLSPLSQCRELAVYDDGSGPALYATGSAWSPGATPHIVRWNGATWTSLGGGLNQQGRALAVFDDGSGPALYCGGAFNQAGSAPALGVARWDGTVWQALGSEDGVWPSAGQTIAFDDGNGPALWVGGGQGYGPLAARGVSRWIGGSWVPSDAGLDASSSVQCFVIHDDGSGPALFAGGTLLFAGTVQGVARWNGSSWQPVGALPNAIAALAIHDDGSGPALYAGGTTPYTPGSPVLVRWTGSSWTPVGTPLAGPGWLLPAEVDTLASHDDGTGPALYVGGYFTSAGGVPLGSVARWDGIAWSAMGGGVASVLVSPRVLALSVHDDGTGPRLVAGGLFSMAGSISANNVAAWNGTTWSALGSGLGVPSSLQEVRALTTWDDGQGALLYAGGRITGGWSSWPGLSHWDGSSWSAVAGLVGFPGGAAPAVYPGVRGLTGFDDGSGPALFVTGALSRAGAHPSLGIAKWGAVRPQLSLSQPGGPGSGVLVQDLGLTVGTETFNVFSLAPCPLGPGGGPYLGLCSPNVGDLVAQVLLPLGTVPFHFLAPNASATFGPYSLPAGITLEGICFAWTGTGLGCVSPVRRLVVQ